VNVNQLAILMVIFQINLG